MKLDRAAAWLQGVTHLASPNFDARPPDTTIDLLVVHNISLPAGEFGTPYIDALFTNQLDSTAHTSFASLTGLKVSAHALIRRTGVITQYVSLRDRAWHAGQSQFQGRDRCNDFSIGIELEGTDTRPYTDHQYQQLAQVIHLLQQTYPAIQDDHIVGHCDIAPKRKTDPGEAFDWVYLRRLLTWLRMGRR